VLGSSLAADAGKGTVFADQQEIDVDGCIIARGMGIATGAGPVSLRYET